MFLMDKLKFQSSRQVSHVLSQYKCNTMDELAKDLNNALDESSDFRVHDTHTKVKRSKTWKCRSKTKNNMIYCNMLKYGAKSEDSESSLDNFPQQEMDVSRKGSHHYTDSDDILSKVNHSSWRHCSTNLGESDSVNENLHPLREPRRKRKFKRMSVDPPSVAEHEFPSLSSIPFCSQKSKRLRNLKSQTVSKITVRSPPKHPKFSVSQLSAEMENICKDFGNASSGKRKRAHERSFDSNNGYELQDFHSDKQSLSNPCHHSKNDVTTDFYDMHNSCISSSESDCGVLTNDESREADDEQSDFFQESGPAYGIPNFIPWWQDDDLILDDQMFDPDFQTILTKSFQHMSDAAKKMYNMQVDNYKAGRQIRSGRRRLGKGSTPKQHQRMISPEELPIPSTNEYDAFNLSVDNCLTKITPNEKKKRKGMPPLTGNIHGLAEFYPCIPESNVGFQVLKNMGWKPGTGLGSNGEGIVSPVKPSVSHGKQGLGFSKRNSENVHSAPPPPPPSSPQPFATKAESLC